VGFAYQSLRDAVAGYIASRDEAASATDQFTADGSQDGTLSGTASRVDDGGLAYSMGSTGEINCGDAIGDVGTGPISMGVWVKGGGTSRGILAKDSSAGAGNGLYVYTRGTTGAPYAYWNGTSAFEFGANDGSWHHLGFSRESNAPNKLLLFYNGVHVATATEPRTLSNATAFRIGRFSDTGSFNGLIDDVVAYHRVLTPTEFAQLASQRGAPYARTGKKRPRINGSLINSGLCRSSI
jgi:hypothetical protein